MFAVIEFKEADGGGLSIVNSQWLTPRKKEVFWPPIKNNCNFSKVLRRVEQDIDPEKWKLFQVEKVFYETEDFDKAKEKLRQAEVTSDLHTDVEDPEDRRPRRKIKKRSFIDESDEDESENESLAPKKLIVQKKLLNLPRPPRIQFKLNNNTQEIGLSQNTAEEEDETDDGSSINNSEANSYSCLSTPKSTASTGCSSVVTPRTNGSSSVIDLENSVHDMPGFRVLLNNLLKIKEQNRQILDILKKSAPPQIVGLPEALPVSLPVTETEDLAKLESFLEKEEHFYSFKSFCLSVSNSKDLVQKTNRLLRSILSDSVAKNYNYYGNNRQKPTKEAEKSPFWKLHLNKIIIDAVKHQCDFSSEEVERAIKNWLKHAPSRKMNKS